MDSGTGPPQPDARTRVILLGGVSGVGKTTVGRRLAAELGWHFAAADALQPPRNILKMRRGLPLTDQDRRPWLESVRNLIERTLEGNRSAVIECSCLKRAYRDFLIIDPARVKLVFLTAGFRQIRARIEGRPSHFFPARLLHSQFETLELPASENLFDASGTVEKTVAEIRGRLELAGAAARGHPSIPPAGG